MSPDDPVFNDEYDENGFPYEEEEEVEEDCCPLCGSSVLCFIQPGYKGTGVNAPDGTEETYWDDGGWECEGCGERS